MCWGQGLFLGSLLQERLDHLDLSRGRGLVRPARERRLCWALLLSWKSGMIPLLATEPEPDGRGVRLDQPGLGLVLDPSVWILDVGPEELWIRGLGQVVGVVIHLPLDLAGLMGVPD